MSVRTSLQTLPSEFRADLIVIHPQLWVIPILPFLTRAPLSIHHQVLEEATSVLHPPTSSQLVAQMFA